MPFLEGMPSSLPLSLLLTFALVVWLDIAHSFGISCSLNNPPKFAPHLERTIKNPFPGIPALEKAIGRKIVDRIGSNEGIPVTDHPLAG